MVVLIKVGRRINRNTDKKWFMKKVANVKNTFSIQQYMWNTINYGIKLATIKMDQEIKKNKDNPYYTFNYTKRKYKEEESLNYDIEWLELIIKGTPEEEQEEYEQSMKFFSTLEENPAFKEKMGKVEVDEDLSAPYSHKLKVKKAKEVLEKGFEKVKDVTIARALNDVGIIVFIEPPKPNEESTPNE